MIEMNNVSVNYGNTKVLKDLSITVKKGEQIGQVGATGCTKGAHLHYEIRIDSVAKDPMLFMDLSKFFDNIIHYKALEFYSKYLTPDEIRLLEMYFKIRLKEEPPL